MSNFSTFYFGLDQTHRICGGAPLSLGPCACPSGLLERDVIVNGETRVVCGAVRVPSSESPAVDPPRLFKVLYGLKRCQGGSVGRCVTHLLYLSPEAVVCRLCGASAGGRATRRRGARHRRLTSARYPRATARASRPHHPAVQLARARRTSRAQTGATSQASGSQRTSSSRLR